MRASIEGLDAGTLRRRRVFIGDLRRPPSPAPVASGAPKAGTAPPASVAKTSTGAALLLSLFLVSLFIPTNIDLGGLRLTPYRLILLVTLIPTAFKVFSGRAGAVNAPDMLMVLYCLWAVLTLFVNHPPGQIWQTAGIFVIESLGAYLLARSCVRSAADVRQVGRTVCIVLTLLVPFVALEALTGRRILAELAPGGLLGPATPHYETRWGMTRAGWPMEHPILLGVVASMGFSLGWFAVRRGRTTPLLALPAAAIAFFSLSLGAYISVAVQLGLIIYERFSRWLPNRWPILVGTVCSLFLALTIASNRGPFVIAMNLFAFNDLAAWTRVRVFRHVTEVITDNPLFGIGLNEWRRPEWTLAGWELTNSIDNFWFVIGVRHGLVAVLVLLAACVITLVAASRIRLDTASAGARLAVAFTVVAVMVTIYSVHLWNASYTLFMFFVGSLQWSGLLDRPNRKQ